VRSASMPTSETSASSTTSSVYSTMEAPRSVGRGRSWRGMWTVCDGDPWPGQVRSAPSGWGDAPRVPVVGACPGATGPVRQNER
jgi:hypothetical protein